MRTRSSIRRTGWHLLVALALASVTLDGAASASDMLPAQDPLTDEEALERSVSAADAICFASRVASGAVKVDGLDGVGIIIHPTEILKGELPMDSLFAALRGPGFPGYESWRATPDSPSPSRLHFLTRVGSTWVSEEGPSNFGNQKLKLDAVDRADLRTRIHRVLARQSTDSLLARSDVVVVATWQGQGPCACKAQGHDRGCQPVQVDRVLLGKGIPRTLDVYSPYFDVIRRGQSLLFLQRAGPNAYTVLSGFAGAVLNDHGRAGKTDRPFVELERRVRAAVKTRTTAHTRIR